jgi:hypothetical protein
LLEIFGLAREGFSDEQIAEILGVAAETFGRNKRKKQPDGSQSPLKSALDKGRHPLNVMVENALLMLAMGCTIRTTIRTWYEYEDLPDGTIGCLEVTETITELPPDLNAIMLWLKAHQPEIYNVKPFKMIDIVSNNREIHTEMPKISEIEHVYGASLLDNLRIAA